MADLRFGAGGYTAPVGTVDLGFGADGEDLPENRRAAVINALLPVPTAGLQADARLPLQASISATLPAPAASAEGRLVVRGGMAATLAPPVAMVQAQRDINVYRDPSRLAASGWEQAERVSAATASRYQQGGRRRAEAATCYQQASALARQQASRAQQLPRGDARIRVRQEHGAPLPAHHRARNRYLPWLDRYRTAQEQQGAALWLSRGVLGRYLPHLRTGWGLPYEQATRILALHWGSTWQEA